jgi:predicted HTH transcriptional regulator
MDPADIDRIAAITDPGYTRGRPPRFTHRDGVLLALVALRTNLTERALAAIFGISQSTAHRAIRDLVASISDLFVPGQ